MGERSVRGAPRPHAGQRGLGGRGRRLGWTRAAPQESQDAPAAPRSAETKGTYTNLIYFNYFDLIIVTRFKVCCEHDLFHDFFKLCMMIYALAVLTERKAEFIG